MWKNAVNTDGFELTFSPDPASEFSGWPDETHVFGYTLETANLQTITFSEDLQKLEICVDSIGTGSVSSDFEGFKFTETNGNVQTLSPNCDPWYSYDLTQGRLIGFRVINSFYMGARMNIRAIAPIIDTMACEYSEIASPNPSTNPVSDMTATILSGIADTQDLTTFNSLIAMSSTVWGETCSTSYTKSLSIQVGAPTVLTLSGDENTLTL